MIDNAIGMMEKDEYEFMNDEVEQKYYDKIVEYHKILESLKEDSEKIENPEEMGSAIYSEILNQISNQIGLDITNETLNQKYNREHPETYDEVKNNVMRDERYISKKREIHNNQINGELKDEYTGQKLDKNSEINLDHTVSRKEIFENQRRRQANIPTEDLANKDSNLNPTNEALNKSKGAKSVNEYIAHRKEREESLKKQNYNANKKIDESNIPDLEKRIKKEKNNKRLLDKLSAKDELMKKKDVKARADINNDIKLGVVKQTGKKAGEDALKYFVIEALIGLLKEVINALISFFKSAAKTFNVFVAILRKAITRFLNKISSFVSDGLKIATGTVVAEIFGPIISLFKKLASIIKQGVGSLVEAISYLKNEKNKNKSLSVKMAEIGKIVVAALVATGAIFGGEIFESTLLKIPILGKISIPSLGTLANVIGIFLSSMICGIIGAIILNLIDKFISGQLRYENRVSQNSIKNKIINNTDELLTSKQERIEKMRDSIFNISKKEIKEREILLKSIHKETQQDLNSIKSKKEKILKMIETLKEDE